jgi:hypothetical protein
MTRRYADVGPAAGEPERVISAAQQAVATGRLIISADPDGLWALRWSEGPASPRRTLFAAETGPLDEAYRLARYLRDESDSSYVSVTVGDGPSYSPMSSTTSRSDGPVRTFEVSIRCADVAALTDWARDRFGVAAWDEVDARTRVEGGGGPSAV